MRKLTGGLIALVFLLCAFTAQAALDIDVSVPSAGEACTNDLSCGDNETCINDICIPSAGEACSSSEDCTLGGACDNQTWICVPSVGDSCSSTEDCGPDGACINDICVPSVVQACSSTEDCGEGEICIGGICVPGCEDDADCVDEGAPVCNTDSNECVECLGDVDCVDEGAPFCNTDGNECVECVDDTDCAESQTCENNMCEGDIYCSDDADCSPEEGLFCLISGKVCIDDITSAPTSSSCTIDEDCDEGSSCVQVRTCEEGCRSDEDCDEGVCKPGVFQCVECLTTFDCEVGSYCLAATNACVPADQDCELYITPRRIMIQKKTCVKCKANFYIKKLVVRANSNFVLPRNEFGTFDVMAISLYPFELVQFLVSPSKIEFVIKVPFELEPGFYPISIGSCVGEIQMYRPRWRRPVWKFWRK